MFHPLGPKIITLNHVILYLYSKLQTKVLLKRKADVQCGRVPTHDLAYTNRTASWVYDSIDCYESQHAEPKVEPFNQSSHYQTFLPFLDKMLKLFRV